MYKFSIKAFLALAVLATASLALAQIQMEAKLLAPAKVGDNVFELRLKGHDGKPLAKAKVTITVTMVGMDHGKSTPKVDEKPDGLYTAPVKFMMGGKWRVAVSVTAKGQDPGKKDFDFTTGSGAEAGEPEHTQHQHEDGDPMDGQMTSMQGVLGPWVMTREGSGTTWLPDSAPMFMNMLPESGGWNWELMGFVFGEYADAGGPRGDSRMFSSSMVMLNGKRPFGKGKLGIHTMFSADPFNGRRGYPNLFQTGETAGGEPIKDHQHPHDIVSELAVLYSQAIGKNSQGFVYLAPIGEPALGSAPFAHRASGVEIPESTIGHHWFDGTHITYGVATIGATFDDKWKIDASAFKGREPDENRFNIDPIKLDSYSGRVTFNPNRDVSAQVSYGYIKEPESLEPGEDQHRITASVHHNKRMGDADLSTTLLWGRNIKNGAPATNAIALESSLICDSHTLFARWENVEKDELVDVPPGIYRINKFTLGGIKNFANRNGYVFGAGAFVGLFDFPSSLDPFYGKNPVSFGVFLRIRPGTMRH